MTPKVREAMTLARRYATAKFTGLSDAEAMIADAVSRAWQYGRTAGPRATPTTIAKFAVRRVADLSRRFDGKSLSIDHPRHRPQTEALGFDIANYHRVGDNPAKIVQAKLDLADWLATLPARLLTVALLFATGHRNEEIAVLLKVSRGRISQLRDELRESWRERQDG